MNILKENGIFAFICSNKFAKAKYGEKLRKLILNNQLKIYNDYTGVKIFKEASVDTCVIQIKKAYVEDNEVHVDDKYYMEQSRLDSNSFTFNSPEILDLRDKIFNQGTLIKDLDIQINYGIKTGFNKAFIIDEETKDMLIKKDFNNKEIIKPLLRGRDIGKWKISYKNLYVIFTRRGININNYPVIKEFLSQYKDDLTPKSKNAKNSAKGRKPGPYKWYEIQDNVAYYSLFEKEKLIYPNMADSLYPIYDKNKYYTNQKCFILTSDSLNLKYLNGLLSSNVVNFVFKLIGSNLGSQGYDLNKIFIEQLPLVIKKDKINKVSSLIDNILNLSEQIVKNENIVFDYLYENLKIEKLSKKLENYYKLSEQDFLKEIKKKTKQFDENEILEKFNNSKNLIITLNLKLNEIIDELNMEIYKIYGLNENEIKIIEDNC